MQSQFAERRPSKPEQTGQGVAATADPRTRLEDAITALLPAPQSPLHEVAHFHFSRFGKLLRGRTALAVAASPQFPATRAVGRPECAPPALPDLPASVASGPSWVQCAAD